MTVSTYSSMNNAQIIYFWAQKLSSVHMVAFFPHFLKLIFYNTGITILNLIKEKSEKNMKEDQSDKNLKK